MSTALALAGVTAVLRDLLNNGLIDQNLVASVGDVTVSALPPDRIRAEENNDSSQLNVFLYQVSPNLGWRNACYPSFSARGQRVSNPPLALDLHYLLSAYGAEDLHAEILLGYAMQLLHETPVLSRDAIRAALAPPMEVPTGGGLPDRLRVLATTDLADQLEQIKIVPEELTTEEISKLWAAFQTNYRPTAAYHASVVLIERHRSARVALPVLRRGIHVRQLRRPAIHSVRPQFLGPGDTLTIEGENLKDAALRVSFGVVSAVPNPNDIEEDRIRIAVPAGLLAGINTVQVVHDLDLGTPVEPHGAFESNVAAFVLRPAVTPGALQNQQVLTGNLRSAELPVTFDPPVGKKQRVLLLLSEATVPTTRPARAYSFEAPPRNQPADPDTTTQLTVPITSARTGTYLVRLQVDGADSSLQTDPSGAFSGPTVTLT